jgi:hypothetical protein
MVIAVFFEYQIITQFIKELHQNLLIIYFSDNYVEFYFIYLFVRLEERLLNV